MVVAFSSPKGSNNSQALHMVSRDWLATVMCITRAKMNLALYNRYCEFRHPISATVLILR